MVLRSLIGRIATKSFANGAMEGEEYAAGQLKNMNVQRLLDIGCGDGAATMQFALLVEAEALFGVDFDEEDLKTAESKGIKCYSFDFNKRWDIESDYFDVIVSRFSFEHLHYCRIFLQECHRCLRPGGKLVIITENLSSWINIAALFMGWQPFSLAQFDGWFIGNPLSWHTGDIGLERSLEKWEDAGIAGMMGHVRVISFAGLRDLLSKAAFKDVQVRTWGYLPLWGKISRIMCRIDRRHGHILVAVCSKEGGS